MTQAREAVYKLLWDIFKDIKNWELYFKASTSCPLIHVQFISMLDWWKIKFLSQLQF